MGPQRASSSGVHGSTAGAERMVRTSEIVAAIAQIPTTASAILRYSTLRDGSGGETRRLAGRLKGFEIEPESALGQAHQHRVANGFGLIVGSQFLPQTPNLQADDGVVLRVVGRGFREGFESDCVFLQALGLAV